MAKFFEKFRMIMLVVILLTALSLCLVRLMKIQIVEGESLLRQSVQNVAGIQQIIAPRGEIVDSNGDPLVQNKVGYNVIIEYSFFPSNIQKQNEIILRTVDILKEYSHEYNESIPVSKIKPYEYIAEKDAEVNKLKSNLRLNTYATAENCIDKLLDKYKIDEAYSADEKRIIAGVRYEMLIGEFSVSNRYILSKDISIEAVSKIEELSYFLKGVDVVEEAIRVYSEGTIFPHGIGTVGPIYQEEYQTLKELGYKYNDVIGKSGIEKAMENVLRGTNGTRRISISSDKNDVSIKDDKEAISGNTVKLTIDKDFQNDVQEILKEQIDWLHEMNDKGKDAFAGSITVLDVKTGAVLALATYPSYDINDYLTNYNVVANGEDNPLINRPIDGLYRPGSTFKPITATAALCEGIIDKNSTVFCQLTYPFLDTVVHCTKYHGNQNVVQAIQNSCNIFFYDISQKIGIQKLVEYEKMFGFGTELGLEIGGKKGYLASPDTFVNLRMDWTPGQLLQAAIGQSEIAITPLQMGVQALTLANKGVRYRPYLVDSVWSYNMEEQISKAEPFIEGTIQDPTGTAFDLIKQGMILASQNTIAFGKDLSLTNLPYEVAIKTGTPQSSNGTDSCVIGYYPANDPQIAFSIVIDGGEYSKYAVRKIIDAYFGYENASNTTVDDSSIISGNDIIADTTEDR